jgi:hypothetical protein
MLFDPSAVPVVQPNKDLSLTPSEVAAFTAGGVHFGIRRPGTGASRAVHPGRA